MFRRIYVLILLLVLSIVILCGRREEKPISSGATNQMPSIATNPLSPQTSLLVPSNQIFFVRGVVHELDADGKTVVIRHDNIPGYMKAMEMPFEVRNTNELRGLQTNEAISFRLTVTTNDAWIDQVKKLSVAPQELPSRPTVRIVRDVDPLNVGEALPNYHFTNELGQVVNTSQFKGRALAITFIFTRCPFPTYCPKMSSNFAEAQKKLIAMIPQGGTPTNWHLLTISFDTEFDKPTVLKSYAERYDYDPKRWNFLTGDLLDVTAIAEQFGLQFWRLNPNEPLSHNLRTAVIDTKGRVQKVLPENKWTSDELVEEIVKAATVK